MRLETERLYIRPVSYDDASKLQKLMLQDSFRSFIGERPVETIEKTIAYIKSKMIDHHEANGYGNYIVHRLSDDEFVGTVGLFNRPDYEGVDIGYATMDEMSGNGYTYEAARSVLNYAQYELKLPLLTAYTTHDNKASRSIIEKLGFESQGEVTWEDGERLLKFVLTPKN